MNLTKEEIDAIANRLDTHIWNVFHDVVYDIYLEREVVGFHDSEISDEDVAKIKTELKRTL
tara:strand:+ start:270 stop:452 length:183 start_codon:yes stop_codon:yes gene_type:complete